jgi:hypothetical protein
MNPPNVIQRPTMGYYLTLAAAMVGMVSLAVAIQGTRRVLHGEDGLGAFNQAGVPALIVAWGLAYFARLAFASHGTSARRVAVVNVLRVVMAVEVAVAAVGSWFVLTSGAASGDLIGILVLGDVMQIGTLLWLLRYAREAAPNGAAGTMPRGAARPTQARPAICSAFLARGPLRFAAGD